MKQAYLYLENGLALTGTGFGASGTVSGELVFTTGMIGPSEALTDPRHAGKLVLCTFPMLGNCGINQEDMESTKCHMKGIIVREVCAQPSNFRCEENAEDFLREQGVVGITGVDTRMLTQLLRDNGTMKAILSTEKLTPDWSAVETDSPMPSVGTAEKTVLSPAGPGRLSVAVLDYGSPKSVLESLVSAGFGVTVYPAGTSAEEIIAGNHDGVLLSNGPGDPAADAERIQQVRALLGKVPLLGLGLGHQLLALAAGGRTKKMKFGHRGSNYPVRDLTTGKVFITAQCHGYEVETASLAGTGGIPRYENVNDGACEGVDFPALRAFSLQFDPLCHGGPEVFSRFAQMWKEGF